MNFGGRVIALTLTLGMCVSGIIAIFWQQEMQYQLPTPIPMHHQTVAVGEKVSLPSDFSPEKSYFLHFYSPDCPCSRFNARHLKNLIGEFNDGISIVIVVPTEKDIKKAHSEFGEGLKIIADPDGSIAQGCGVYSTPQAAIIDNHQKLYYRGNYNSTRYCTTRATNFAELSLIALINNQPSPAFGIQATQSYGCQLNESDQASFEFF